MEYPNFHSDSKGTLKGELLWSFSDILELKLKYNFFVKDKIWIFSNINCIVYSFLNLRGLIYILVST
jgi:hypothetical protein